MVVHRIITTNGEKNAAGKKRNTKLNTVEGFSGTQETA